MRNPMGGGPPALVIFDCDGVLVDSEHVSNVILASQLREVGLDIDAQRAMELFVGRSVSECQTLITRLLGAPLPDTFMARYHAACEDAFATRLAPVTGTAAAIRALQIAGIPMCVASSAAADRTRRKLAFTGLMSFFADRVFSGEDVARNKPAPDLFLHAAKECGGAAADCIVVEDTAIGVAAGVAAEMCVIALVRTQPATILREAGAHHLIADMSDLPRLLGL